MRKKQLVAADPYLAIIVSDGERERVYRVDPATEEVTQVLLYDCASVSEIPKTECDALVAVWNGLPGRPGGTAHVIELAKRAQKPVLIIEV